MALVARARCVHQSPVARSTGSARSCVHMRNFIPVDRDEKGARRMEYKSKMAPRELISIVPLAVAWSTRVTLSLQLNGRLLKWKIEQISQNTATEATKRPFRHAQLKYFHPGQLGWSVHMSPVNRDPGRRDRDLGSSGWPGSHMNTS